jgi:hypothetical protein
MISRSRRRFPSADSRFDRLTRSLTDVCSRRGALGMLLGGTLGLLGLADTPAKKNSCPPCRKKKAGKCKGKKRDGTACQNGGQCQNGRCVSLGQAAPQLPPPAGDSSPPPLSRTCTAGQCTSDSYCGPGCVCLDIGGVRRRCMAAGICSAEPCTADSCGPSCTCVNPEGGRTRCVSVEECPAGQCTSNNDCGPDCICVNPGSDAARCVSVVR